MLEFEITGASHAEYVGVIAKGLPKSFEIDPVKLADFMKERAPGNSPLATKRHEDDIIEFVSGVEHSVITGDTVEIRIYNQDVKRSDYDTDIIRPGTADYTAKAKYGDSYCETGSGRFSGRMTAPMCALGGIILQILEKQGINIKTEIKSIGKSQNKNEFDEIIEAAMHEGDSVGGIVKCKIEGVKSGIGGPLFEGVEGIISKNIFAIPGVLGIEFGSGFNGTTLKGSENNDSPCVTFGNVTFGTNNQGGISGGITNGMPIEFCVAFKPTPSISKTQNTINYRTKENIKIEIKGRHDPCIVFRAMPVVRAIAAISIYNIIESDRKIETLEGARKEIDEIDDKITELLLKRADISKKIGEIKLKECKNITNQNREAELLNRAIIKAMGDPLKEKIIRDFYEDVFTNSKLIQENIKGGKYGLLGAKLSHSISPEIHSRLGNYSYEIFETEPENLSDFLKAKNFSGINVTIPYKREVVKYLDELIGEAADTGVVNTIVNKDGRLLGYNTDCFGFRILLKTAGIGVSGKKCLILGNGGAAQSVLHVLTAEGAQSVQLLKRNETPKPDAEIIINATPVGMWPETSGKIVNIKDFPNAEAAIDLIYNPFKTDFLIDAKLSGITAVNGLMMLVAQAVYSSFIWQGKECDLSKMLEESYRIYSRIITNNTIVLIGMPGSGKTTVGGALAEKLGKKFIDIDAYITENFGKTPAKIIEEDGEDEFRKIETLALSMVCREKSIVLATGGGVVTREENYGIIAKNGIVCYLDTPLNMLATNGRPLTKIRGNPKLYEERKDAYERWADVRLVL